MRQLRPEMEPLTAPLAFRGQRDPVDVGDHRAAEHQTSRPERAVRTFPIPCSPSPALSSAFGVEIAICDVTKGPTSSWKDCVAPSVVEAALQVGLRRVIVASSGNHGRAIAFACRASGLQAGILVYERTPPDVVASLLELGAKVFRYPDRASVHAALDVFVSDGWFSATLTDRLRGCGSMPGAIGYRRIAMAITQAVAGDPLVVVPTCYGDGAAAIQRHLVAMGRRPLMCLVRASQGDGSIAASIATDVMTPQVSSLLASGAFDFRVTDPSFRAGLKTMEAAVGKHLDFAEGGIPDGLSRLVAMWPSPPRRPVVCVVTGGVCPGLNKDRGMF